MKLVCLFLLALCGGLCAQDPMSVLVYNETWAARVEWAGSVGAGLSQSLVPTIPIPADATVSVVLGGHTDGAESVLTLSCSEVGYVAKTPMYASYGVAIEWWTFTGAGSCVVSIDNTASDQPVSTFFIINFVETPGRRPLRGYEP